MLTFLSQPRFILGQCLANIGVPIQDALHPHLAIAGIVDIVLHTCARAVARRSRKLKVPSEGWRFKPELCMLVEIQIGMSSHT